MQLTRRPDADNDMTFGRGLNNFASNSEAVRINIVARLRVLLGEWFLDGTVGVPYFQKFTTKPVDLSYVQASLKQTILKTEDVVELKSFNMVFDNAARSLSVKVSYTDEYSPEVQSLEVTQ